MNDGQELIAKIPNPNAGPPDITVASEAATMTFVSPFHSSAIPMSAPLTAMYFSFSKLRTVLNVPVPEVCAWSSLPSASNPVGAEYIIMKKAKGRQLSEIWTDISDTRKSELVKNSVSVEAKMAKSRLKNYGSLYFRDIHSVSNCNDNANDVLVDSVGNEQSRFRFIIGATVERSFRGGGRGSLDIDRGPCEVIYPSWQLKEITYLFLSAQGERPKTMYFSATASRELAWLRNLESKGDPIAKSAANTRPYEPSIHIRLLEQFLSIVPFVLPKDQFINYPTLWHTDLHGDNIFVDPTNPSKITSIIDWQSISANPFFMQTRFPSIFDCDWPYPWGALVPRLVENYDVLPPDAQEKERQQYQDVRLKKYYEVASRKFNPLVLRALDSTREEGENDVQISTLLAIVGRTWLDGPIPLRDVLIQIFENWGHFSADTACPIYFSQEEIARSKEEAKQWASAYEEFDRLRKELVGEKERWVSGEEYEEAKRRYEENKGLLDELRRKLELAGGG